MPTPMKKIDLTTAKIFETPTGGTIKEIAEITDSLSDALECLHGQFKIAANTTDAVVSLGNITTAKVFILKADGVMSAKLNGSTEDVNFTTLILFNTNIDAITVTNSDLANARTVEIYIATDTD